MISVPRPSGATAHTFESHGSLIGVVGATDGVREALERHLPEGARSVAATRVNALYAWSSAAGEGGACPQHVVQLRCSFGGNEHTKEIARTSDLEYAAALLRHDAEFRIALHAPDRLFLHAAAVAWRGRVIVVPGHSRAGKSTLTAALVYAGAEYLSDEYTVIDADGLVHPFARRLHLRHPEGRAPRAVTPQELGGSTAQETRLPIGMVVAAQYRAGSRWRPRVLPSGETALAMFDNAIVARARPQHAMDRLATALRFGAIGLAGPRGDANDTARAILRRADRLFGTRAVA